MYGPSDVRNDSILLLSTPQRGKHWTVYKLDCVQNYLSTLAILQINIRWCVNVLHIEGLVTIHD